jgi:hypothetical protein
MERTPLQYAAGTLAGSAFIATTQILTGVALDLPLYVALAAFATNIPFQIILFFMPVPFSIEEAQRLRATRTGLSQRQKTYCLIYCLIGYCSMPAIVIGFVAMFCHFAWWLGVLFALAALAAYRIYRDSALEDFKQRPNEYK